MLNQKLLAVCDLGQKDLDQKDFYNFNDMKVDIEELKRLLRAGADINATDTDGSSCLMKTGWIGSYEERFQLIYKQYQ